MLLSFLLCLAPWHLLVDKAPRRADEGVAVAHRCAGAGGSTDIGILGDKPPDRGKVHNARMQAGNYWAVLVWVGRKARILLEHQRRDIELLLRRIRREAIAAIRDRRD